jgi:hypothetical protein
MIPTKPCRYCGRPIGVVLTAVNGRRMPIDPTPNELGNVIVSRNDTGQLLATVVGKNTDEIPIGTRFMPHFATCERYPKRKRR